MKITSFLRRSYFLLAVSAPLLYACTEPECTNLNDPKLIVQFKTKYRATRQQQERDTLIEIIAVYGQGEDNKQIKIDTVSRRTNNLVLPLDQGNDKTKTTFIIEWRRYTRGVGTQQPVRIDSTSNRRELLTVHYTLQPFFVSDACGFDLRYNDLKRDSIQTTFPNSFPSDSIKVIKNVVDETNAPNIKIYF